ARALERHDGLQVDLPVLGKPFGFAVDRLWRIKGKKAEAAFEAPAGALVEVELPPDHPELPVGATVYCSSSQAVKRNYRHDRPKPGLYRPRRGVNVEVAIEEDRLTAIGRVSARPGEQAIEVRRELAGPFPAAKDVAVVEQMARGAFEKLGDTSLSLDGFV